MKFSHDLTIFNSRFPILVKQLSAMNIFGVGLPEVTVILILALLIFGPKKLPELGKQLGKTLKSLKKASNEFQNEIDQVMNEEVKEESPKSIESNQINEINQEKIDSENSKK